MRNRNKLWLGSALLLGLFSYPSVLWGQITPDNPPASGAKEQKAEPGSPDPKIIMSKLHGLSVDQRIIIDRLDQVLETLRQDKTAKAVVPVNGVEPRKLPEETISLKPEMNGQDQMSALSKKMDEIIKISLQVQVNTRDLTDLKRRHDTMQIDVSQLQSDITRMQQEIGRVRSQMDGMRSPTDIGREDMQRRSSASLPLPVPPDSSSSATPSRPLLGTVKLMNSYLFPVNVVVDGRLYPLGTNETLSLDRLPGTFTYEVVGIQGNTLRSVGAGETLTIRVVPR